MTTKTDKNIEALQLFVEGLHNCKAKYKEKIHVTEKFKGDVVWDGDAYVFTLIDHPKAKIAYAWSSPVKGSSKRRFYAVLRAKPITTALDAVRASIANDYKR
jgi:hypothetical protein